MPRKEGTEAGHGALHSGPSSRHFAAISTVNRIQSAEYWWPYLIRDVRAKSICGQF